MDKNTQEDKVVIEAKHMSMYPSMGSLEACVDMACSQLPITDKNAIISLMMVYHNTLLATIAKKEA